MSLGIQPIASRDRLPLSFAQERLWFLYQLLQQIGADTAAYNMPLALWLRGDLDISALRASLAEIVRRHDALRTTIQLDGGEAVQQVAPAGDVELTVVEVEDRAAAARRVNAEARRPLDLTAGPLYRFVLYRVDAGEHLLFLTISHVVCDGWSYGVLWRELAQCYAANVAGDRVALPPLPIQYGDYARWQRDWYDDEADRLLDYWDEQLVDMKPLELPADRPRPKTQTFRGNLSSFVIPSAAYEALKELGQQQQCTAFMTVLTLFNLLLARYADKEEVVVGTPVANRDRLETEPLIGLFVNNLVLRTDLTGSPSFAELLRRVRDVCIGAIEHQEMPFEQLVVELSPLRDASRNPLFQIAFSFDQPVVEQTLANLSVTGFDLEHVTSKFDLTLAVIEQDDGLRCTFEYNSDLFEAATIARLRAHFEQLLGEVVAAPDKPVWQHRLVTLAEEAVIASVHQQREFAVDRCVHELVEEQAATRPDALAVAGPGGSLTYRELNALANRVAHALRQQGAGPGTLVGVLMARRPAMVAALLGVMKSGAAYVPMDPANPAERQALMVEDAGMPVLLTEAEVADGAAFLAGAPDTDPTLTTTPDDLAYVIFTSGSTGRPKGVEIPHRSLLNLIGWHREEYRVTPADRATQIAGLAFDASVWELWPYLTAGASVHLPSDEVRADPARLLRWLADEKITLSFLPTPLAEAMLAQRCPEGLALRAMLTGGDKLNHPPPPGLPFTLVNHYGPTENAVVATWAEVPPGSGADRAPSIGRPICNVEVLLLDSHGESVPIGVPGELCIAGKSLARGYHQRPDLTVEKFVSHPQRAGERTYRTGDLARWQPDGQIEFLGRIDHQVKVRGFRIELGEIEHVLAQHPSVVECAVVAPHKRSGERQLAGYVTLADDTAVADLRSYLRERLPEYMVPAALVVLDAMPLTPNEKVDRKALAERETAGATEAFSEPVSETEKIIVEIWRDLLEVEQVGRDDNFFDLGGHSLLIVQLRTQLQQRLGHALTIAEVFQYPTVSSMAEHLTGGEQAAFRGAKERVRQQRHAAGTGAIAVIGMAGRFPKARDLDEFWQNLRSGTECVSFFSEDEVRQSAVVPEATLRDENYVRARAILSGIEDFDASFFGVSPREAASLDPQQRLFLECAWEALEGAGYDPQHTTVPVGVFAGCGPNNYYRNNVLRSAQFGDADAMDQSLADLTFLATRVSYKLNLKGPSIEVNTACSTSLVAVVQACQSLLAHQCDMSLAGGVFVGVPQRVGHLHREGEIFSPDGHCRAFDARAAGTFSGEGAGIVLLKRLEDAQRDGDAIRAVILGSALNNDGSNKVGFTAPSVEGQAEVIAVAQGIAGIDPATIGSIEAHGTATPLGDPIEVAALTKAFRVGTDAKAYCALGSVKSNIGHADAAAGVAGLIKSVLSLEHGEIPPSLHFEEPNPEADFASSPFFVPRELRPWPLEGPRRAGVSSFGIGGTNAHVVLQQAPAQSATPAPEARDHVVLTQSAKTPSALDAMAANLSAHLRAHPDLDLADVAFTLQQSRSTLPQRRAIVRGPDGSEQTFDGAPAAEAPPVVFLFPGQGAQYVDMGRDLYDSELVYRQAVDRCCGLLVPHLGLDLRTILYPDSATEEHSDQLQQTRLTQPALFVVEYALAQLWQSWGVAPLALVGHSIGEFVAAHLAGVFTLESALGLVAARGQMMQDLPTGDMLSVPLSEDEVAPLLGPELSLAAVNSPNACVVSGAAAAVARLQQQLAQRDLPCRMLHTSHAFHSAMMQPIVAPFVERVRAADPQPAQLRCVSTVTGEWIDPADWASAEYWGRNLLQPVRFAAAAATVLGESDRVLLEVGPGQVLSALVRQQGAPARDRVVVPSMRQPKHAGSDTAAMLGALAKLWLAGVVPDWQAFSGEERRRVPLPTYPFERQRYWLEPQPATASTASLDKKPDVGDWFYLPSWQRASVPAVEAATGHWLVLSDHDELPGLLGDGAKVTRVVSGEGFGQRADGSYQIRPAERADYEALFAAAGMPGRVVHAFGVGDAAETRGFYSLLALTQVLGSAESEVRVDVLCDNLFDVIGGEASLPERATMVGPCRVAPAEFKYLSCRLIDFDRWQNPALAAQLSAPHGEPIVAVRGTHCWRPTIEPTHLSPAADDAPWRRRGGTVIITGGVGGVGLELARHLGASLQSKLVLVTRSAIPATGGGDKMAQRRERLESLRASGIEFAVEVADVADREAMAGVVERTLQRHGAVHGVIHAAGLATGGLIAARTAAEAAEVLAPKVRGTLILQELLADQPLDFFVLCSSLASVLGGVGAADYCGANAFLDALAAARSAEVPYRCINWDAWRDVGMAAEVDAPVELREQHARTLASGIGNDEGFEVLARALSAAAPQLLVSTHDFAARRAPAPAVTSHPAGEAEGHARPALATDYAAPETETQIAIATAVQQLLGVDRVGLADNFFDLGFDSLIGHRLIGRLKQRHQINLPLRAVLESPTVAELAKFAEMALFAAGGAKKKQAAPAAPMAPRELQTSNPLFVERRADGTGREVWLSRLDPTRHWFLGEHRIQGHPVMVGTGYLELARAAYEEFAGPGPVELRQVFLLSPLALERDEPVEVRTTLERQGDQVAFTIASGPADDPLEHATGQIGAATSPPVDRDVAALRRACSDSEVDLAGEEINVAGGFMHLSDRWRSARRAHYGHGARLTEIALADAFAADVEQFVLHPALLDVAVAFRDGDDNAGDREEGAAFLPFAYDRVVVHAAMPAQFSSYIEQREHAVAHELKFDLTLFDDQGHPIVEVEGYTRRRVEMAASPVANVTLEIVAPGDLDQLAWRRSDRRPPAAGEIEIEVAATGMNFKDVLFALGLMSGPDGAIPEIGLECVGTVVAVGEGVTELSAGERVMAVASPAYCRFVTCPAHVAAAIPDRLSAVEAATMPIPYLTAYYSLVTLGHLRRGERVLIHAASGGVGLAAVRVARWLGAEVYATAGREEKRAYLRSIGIEHVMDSRSLAFADEVMNATGGAGVDVVLNSLAGEFIEKGLSVLGPYGRFLELGAQDIYANTPIGLRPFHNSLSFFAVMIGPGLPTFREVWAEMMAHVRDGSFEPLPHVAYPHDRATEAFEFMAAAKHIGRVVVTRDEDGTSAGG